MGGASMTADDIATHLRGRPWRRMLERAATAAPRPSNLSCLATRAGVHGQSCPRDYDTALPQNGVIACIGLCVQPVDSADGEDDFPAPGAPGADLELRGRPGQGPLGAAEGAVRVHRRRGRGR